MIFTSTRDNSLSVKFSQAVKQCLPPDGGVFIPSVTQIEDLRRWIYYLDEKTSFTSIAGTLSSAFMQDEFSPIICQTIAEQAFPFAPVINQLDDNLFHMQIYHGYTGCHRDFGISYLCSYLETTHQLKGGQSVFLDFTHGELGALLAKVLRGKKHVKAVLVYKKGTIRGLSEEDYIWNGGNILPVEMEGDEEYIKQCVNKIFEDKDFVLLHNLTLANTKNVCRIMAQIFFFPYAFAQIKNKTDGDIFYAIESENYTTLMAGLYSWRFALPVNGFYLPATAALNVNAGGSTELLNSFIDKKIRYNTNSEAPANLERLESFFEQNELMMRNFVFPSQINERAREKAAKELFIKYGIFSDPGTASAYAAIKENASDVYGEDGSFVLISQIHPSLNSEYCRHVIGEVPVMPQSIAESLKPVEINRYVISGLEELKKIIKENI